MTRCSSGLWSTPRKSGVTKPAAGHLKKSGAEGVKFQREFRLEEGTNGDLKAGDRVLVDEFKPKEKVDVIGLSKGRGFAGVVKRHHFRGGESRTVRCSIARRDRSARPVSRRACFPGMRMAGQMGTTRVTVRNLEIVEVDTEDNVLLVKGAVPGPTGGYVMVRRAKK